MIAGGAACFLLAALQGHDEGAADIGDGAPKAVRIPQRIVIVIKAKHLAREGQCLSAFQQTRILAQQTISLTITLMHQPEVLALARDSNNVANAPRVSTPAPCCPPSLT